MSNFPFFYDYNNAYNATVSPSVIHITDTALAAFYHRYLLRKAMSVFQWKVPDNWAKNYFLYCLYCIGYVGVINTDKFGVIPQNCTLGGYTVQYQPLYALIANPLLNSERQLIINKDIAIVRMHEDYSGLLDLVYTYGDLMALTVQTMTTNLVNSKLSYMFAASDKATAESLKEIYDRIASGEPAVFYDKALHLQSNQSGNRGNDLIPPWTSFSNDIGRNFITPELIQSLSNIENKFLTDIGMPSANTDKRERLITDEVRVNSVETYSEPGAVLELLQDCCQRVQEMFQIEIAVDWRYKPQIQGQGGVTHAGVNVGDGSLSLG